MNIKYSILCLLALAVTALSASQDIVWVDSTSRTQGSGPVLLLNPTNQFTGTTGSFQTVTINGTNIMPLILSGGSTSTVQLTNMINNASNRIDVLDTNAVTKGMTNAWTVSSHAELMPTAGGTFTGSVYTTVDHMTVAPASDELPNAEWVRSLLSFGKTAYMTTNMYPALWQPTNTTGIASYETQAQFTNNLPVGAVGSYFATMVDTNPVASDIPFEGPATVHLHLRITSGSPAANHTLSIKPEIYYTYSLSATNLTLGDYDADPQTWTAGQDLGKIFAIAWPTVQPTSTYYRVYRAKVTAKGSAITNCWLGIGGVNASYITFQTAGAEASAVQANLTIHTNETLSTAHGGISTAILTNRITAVSNEVDVLQLQLPAVSNLISATQTNIINLIQTNAPVDYSLAYLGYPKLTLTTNMVSSSTSAASPTIPITNFVNAFDADFGTLATGNIFTNKKHAYQIELGATYSGIATVSIVASNASGNFQFGLGYGTANSIMSGGEVEKATYAEGRVDTVDDITANEAGWLTNSVTMNFTGSRIFLMHETQVACFFYIRDVSVWGVTNAWRNYGGTP